MSIWMVFCLLVVVYFEKETINRIGAAIRARLRFEFNYLMIRISMKRMERELG